MILQVALQVFLAFIGTMGFSLIFNVPKKELLYCGIAGAGGWLIYQLVHVTMHEAIVVGILLGAMMVTCISRIISFSRKMPVTVYMIPGVIPLVPGAGIYFTMFHVVMGENPEALLRGIETLRNAGVIALGLLVVLSMPPKLFTLLIRKQ